MTEKDGSDPMLHHHPPFTAASPSFRLVAVLLQLPKLPVQVSHMKREYQPSPEVLSLIEQQKQGESSAVTNFPMQAGRPERGKTAAYQQRRPAVYSPDNYVAIPLYDVRAAAGGGAIVDSEQIVDFLHFKEQWVRAELHAAPSDLYLIYVEGESMEPTLRPGDVILIDHRDQSQARDGIYVLRLDGTLLVKRLPGSVIKVSSDNSAYSPFELKAAELEQNDFSIVGRVVWTGRRM
jgi:phage repressor protein C with HTH and peptisase S24 domain